MSAPDLWGIDPDEIYRWTPKAGREIIDDGEWDGKKTEWIRPRVYGEAKEGAPVVLVAALSEAMAVRVSNAKQQWLLRISQASEKARKEKASKDDATDKILDAGECVYTPSLISQVLESCVIGWENLKSRTGKVIEFKKGDWKRNSAAIPGAWQAELFYSIVNETLFEGATQAPFGSGQD